MRVHDKSLSRNGQSQAGMTLIETMVALAIMLVVSVGVMTVAGVAVSTTETQGHLAARTAEYAQDKMEQLLALKFCDGGTDGKSGTDTTQYPAVAGLGATYTGLAGCSDMVNGVPLTGGSLSASAPTTGYVDYLDATGSPLSSTGNWEYIRVWQISIPPNSAQLKQISVLTQARRAVGTNNGLLPTSTVTALKTFPF
jgi:prepilin-type N-terminal cleavage/methylation domain-containing protein